MPFSLYLNWSTPISYIWLMKTSAKMQQFHLILVVLLFAGSDAFLVSLLRPQLNVVSSYNYKYRPLLPASAAYPSLSPAYNSRPSSPVYSVPPAPARAPPKTVAQSPSYVPIKIPVWQLTPSTTGYLTQPYAASLNPSVYYQLPQTYSSPDFNTYSSFSYHPPADYHSFPSPYDDDIIILNGDHLDYMGRPLVSTPVYFPRDRASEL